MRTPELIATHTNTDFDAFAAMVAARKLYPEARLCLGGAVNRNVREFQALYADAVPVVDPADVDRDSVRRLILVDTVHAGRLGDLGDLCGREGVQVIAFDHHAHADELPDYLAADALVSSNDGSLVTLLVRIIAERGIPVTPFEATVFALGIHEDTGSLTFATTTTRDAEALAFCMRAGADTELLEKWLANALTPAQRLTLAAALETAEELPIPEASVRFSMTFSRPAKAPPQMNRMLVVSICRKSWLGCLRPPWGGTLAMVPSMSLSNACCTPSPDTSRVMETFSVRRAILSISSM